MGYGSWSDEDYLKRAKTRATKGESAFKYTDEEMKGVRPEERKVNQKMDPRGVIRESRDSATHPESLAIGVIFDHTGSMREIPRILQKWLTQLMGALLKSGIENPQILFGAVGDATIDRAPLQIGQFESDINMEDDLGRLLLEGGGGPYGQESYELAIYFMARHTSIDCLEKRKKKGYLFLIGDEIPYHALKPSEIKGIIGDELSQDVPVQDIIAEAKEKYNVFFIIPTGAFGGRNPDVVQYWVGLLGQEYVIQLDNPESICEEIARLIKTAEGKVPTARTKTPTAPKKLSKKKKPGRI